METFGRSSKLTNTVLENFSRSPLLINYVLKANGRSPLLIHTNAVVEAFGMPSSLTYTVLEDLCTLKQCMQGFDRVPLTVTLYRRPLVGSPY